MKKLFTNFEKLNRLFQSKREFFHRKIERWKENKQTDLYVHAKDLLMQADAYAAQIKEVINKGHETASLKDQIKKFKKTFKELHEITKPLWRQWAEAIIIAAGLAFVLRTYLFGLYHVPTGSAEPNILVGDRIWGNKFIYYFKDVQRGDLVIFDRPNFMYDQSNPFKLFWQKYIGLPIPFFGLSDVPENWVKRVIALPGDVVEGRVENGKTTVFLNGKQLDEKHVNPYPLIRIKKTTGFFNIDSFGPLAIPSFLRTQTKLRLYTFDPNKSLADQPFYNMTEDEVIFDAANGGYLLEYAFTPCMNRYGEPYDRFGPFTVPQGKYWTMGDSRKNSEDSRYWGFLDGKLIHGRASFIIYSIDSEESFWLFELFKHPISFWMEAVRWARSFKPLR